MSTMFIDFHVLQTVPPSCINRDDSGSPKSAMFGGVSRARVSSQAWKKAVREDFKRTLDESELGERTFIAASRVAQRIAQLDATVSAEAAEQLSVDLFGDAKIKVARAKQHDDGPRSGYLLFLSRAQIERLAELGVRRARGETVSKADVKKAFADESSVDVALFGRMIAEAPDLNVDAACQVAHALSVHPAVTEFDFFTAMDDNADLSGEDGAGAGMLGTVEFTSATLYRYATIDVVELVRALGSAEAAARAVEAFARAFITSMPTGKRNTFANRTRPGAVLVQRRSDQPVNLVGAFEDAIAGDRGILSEAVARLAAFAAGEDAAYGTSPDAAWCLLAEPAVSPEAVRALEAGAERVDLEGLVARLGEAARELKED